MNLDISEYKGVTIAEISSNEIVIKSVDEALDLIGNSGYLGADRIILQEKNLHPDFFDLKTKLAGEILQKFSNYNMRLAIVGDFGKFESKNLRDFIAESNKIGRVIFTANIEEARRLITLR